MPPLNPLDLIADNLATWIDAEATRIATALVGGMAAPFSAHVTEQDKLDYYAAQLFHPDGSPNLEGRAAEMQRLGPLGFAEVYKQVLRAHPEWRQAPPLDITPEDMGQGGEQLAPTAVPGVQEVVTPAANETLQPTSVPGVAEVVQG